MKLSEKRQRELYDAIHEPTMDLRLKFTKSHPPTTEQLDSLLFALEGQIWRRVRAALNLEGPA